MTIFVRSGLTVIAAVALFGPSSLLAATYYVSANDGNDSNAGSQSAPWKTIGKANISVKAGDTVFIRAGVYVNDPIAPASSGTASSQITYSAYQAEQPKIVRVSKNGGTAIVLDGRNYIVVDGVTLDGEAGGQKAFDSASLNHFVSILGGNYNIIRNSTMRDAHGWFGIELSDGAHHNRLENNVIDNVGSNNANGNDKGDLLSIKCANYNLFKGNTVSRGGHNLFEVMGLANVIVENSFDNRWDASSGNRIGDLNTNEKYNCPPVSMRGNTLFAHNFVTGSLPSGDNSDNVAMKVQGNRAIVRNNVFYNNMSTVFLSAVRPPIVESQTARIFNNTLYNNGGLWEARDYGNNGPLMRNVFKNNIVAGVDNQQVIYASVQASAASVGNNPLNQNMIINNAFSGVSQAQFNVVGIGTSNLDWYQSNYSNLISENFYSDPGFAASNPASGKNFELQATSPMVDRGDNLTYTIGAGSGTVLPVQDAGYFFGSIDSGIYLGDLVVIGGAAPVRVVSVDHGRNELRLATSVSWSANQPVNLPFAGPRPDLGAFEFGSAAMPAPGDPMVKPEPPQAFSAVSTN